MKTKSAAETGDIGKNHDYVNKSAVENGYTATPCISATRWDYDGESKNVRVRLDMLRELARYPTKE